MSTTNTTMKPKKGLRFLHRRVLDCMVLPVKAHQLYEVTRITRETVYYRPVYNYGDREALGHPDCCHVDDFDRYAMPLEAVLHV